MFLTKFPSHGVERCYAGRLDVRMDGLTGDQTDRMIERMVGKIQRDGQRHCSTNLCRGDRRRCDREGQGRRDMLDGCVPHTRDRREDGQCPPLSDVCRLPSSEAGSLFRHIPASASPSLIYLSVNQHIINIKERRYAECSVDMQFCAE